MGNCCIISLISVLIIDGFNDAAALWRGREEGNAVHEWFRFGVIRDMMFLNYIYD